MIGTPHYSIVLGRDHENLPDANRFTPMEGGVFYTGSLDRTGIKGQDYAGSRIPSLLDPKDSLLYGSRRGMPTARSYLTGLLSSPGISDKGKRLIGEYLTTPETSWRSGETAKSSLTGLDALKGVRTNPYSHNATTDMKGYARMKPAGLQALQGNYSPLEKELS